MADTDRIHMEVLKRYFENEDFEVHVAHDGEELLEIINVHRPDIVISEVMLQKSDIFLVRENVLKIPAPKSISSILTSYTVKTEDTVSRVMCLGICSYLKTLYPQGNSRDSLSDFKRGIKYEFESRNSYSDWYDIRHSRYQSNHEVIANRLKKLISDEKSDSSNKFCGILCQ